MFYSSFSKQRDGSGKIQRFTTEIIFGHKLSESSFDFIPAKSLCHSHPFSLISERVYMTPAKYQELIKTAERFDTGGRRPAHNPPGMQSATLLQKGDIEAMMHIEVRGGVVASVGYSKQKPGSCVITDHDNDKEDEVYFFPVDHLPFSKGEKIYAEANRMWKIRTQEQEAIYKDKMKAKGAKP